MNDNLHICSQQSVNKTSKISQKVVFFTNEALRRRKKIPPLPIDVKKYAEFESDLRKIHLWAKWRVMNHPIFPKNGGVYFVSGSRHSLCPKVQRTRLWKIVSTSYRIGRIFGRRSVAEPWGATSCFGSLEMCYNPIGRKYTKSWNIWKTHMKWRFWGTEVEVYVGGIEICNKVIGSDDRGGGKWCETPLEWL